MHHEFITEGRGLQSDPFKITLTSVFTHNRAATIIEHSSFSLNSLFTSFKAHENLNGNSKL